MSTKQVKKHSQSRQLAEKAGIKESEKIANDRRWVTQDLKRIKSQACQIRAESLLKNIRHIANQFISERDIQEKSEDGFVSALRRKLFSLNPAARIVRVQEHLIVLKASIPNLIPALPKGYGFKGGAARCILNHTLGKLKNNQKLRDIDLVRFGDSDSEANQLADREVALRFMADDAKHGNGVEISDSIDRYLQTRDLTVNEVVVIEGLVYCSRSCLEDTLNAIVRPSDRYKSNVPSATALKAIRLALELQGNTLRMLGIPSIINATPFEVALQFSRALQSSDTVAKMFIEECVKRGAISSSQSLSIPAVRRHFEGVLGANSPI